MIRTAVSAISNTNLAPICLADPAHHEAWIPTKEVSPCEAVKEGHECFHTTVITHCRVGQNYTHGPLVNGWDIGFEGIFDASDARAAKGWRQPCPKALRETLGAGGICHRLCSLRDKRARTTSTMDASNPLLWSCVASNPSSICRRSTSSRISYEGYLGQSDSVLILHSVACYHQIEAGPLHVLH